MVINRRQILVKYLGLLPFLLNIAVFTFYSFRGLATILYAILILLYLFSGRSCDKHGDIIKCYLIPPIFVYSFSLVFHDSLPNKGILFGLLLYSSILLRTSRNDQKMAFEFFLDCTCLLLLLSIVEFVLVELFGIGLLLGHVVRVEEAVFDRATYFNHYIFNIIKDDVMVRFQSIMEEPGNVGTLCGFLLFVIGNNARYSRQFYIVLIAGFLSLSMAFFALFALFFISNIELKKKKMILIISIIIICGIFFFGEQFESKIVLRLQSENLDDRSNVYFDHQLYLFVKEHGIPFFFGNGAGATNSIDIGRGVVGAKRELFDYGVIGCVLLFLSSFFAFFKYNGISKRSVLFFIAFWLSWYQRADIFNPTNILLFFNVLNTDRSVSPYGRHNFVDGKGGGKATFGLNHGCCIDGITCQK